MNTSPNHIRVVAGPAWCPSRAAWAARIVSSVFSATLALALVACGGGGGADNPPAAGSGNNPPDIGKQGLQAHLSVCPNTLVINKSVACMTGLYGGKTINGGAYCAFNYDHSSGTANYITGGTAWRVDLSLYSAAVFEKKAANNAAGFAISWSIGIASGKGIDVYYRASNEPASASGLLIKPDNASLSACLVESGPVAVPTGAASTANLTGRAWRSPHLLNGSAGALGLFSDQPAFDAGLADDGRAFITFRQPDANGRMAVHVVEGRAGATGQDPSWTAPLMLDTDAPLLAGNFRPRIAVSGNGHAVVAWLTERPCEADAYQSSPAGKTCRYLYASRRLAWEAAWEPARRVRASPPMTSQDHFARINARGDVVLVFPSFYFNSPGDTLHSTTSMLAIRHVSEANYQAARLNGFWTNSVDGIPFGQRIQTELDDSGNLFVAGQSGGPFDQAQLRTTTTLAQSLLLRDVTTASGAAVYELRSSGNGFGGYTWRNCAGSRQSPNLLMCTPRSRRHGSRLTTSRSTRCGATPHSWVPMSLPANLWLYGMSSEDEYQHRLFEDSAARWIDMTQSWRDLLSRHPSRTTENRFAYFACLARDKPVFLELLDRIGETPDLKQWGTNPRRTFDTCKRWAQQQ